jgi:hypothetical protein
MPHDHCAAFELSDVEQKAFGLVINELRGLIHVGMDTEVTKLHLLGLVQVRNEGGATRKGHNRTSKVWGSCTGRG